MTGRPVLAVAYDVTSSSPLELTEALGDRYDLVWVVDATDPSLGSWVRLLPRLGRVVDVAGRPERAVADDLRAAGAGGVLACTDSQLLPAARLAAAAGLEGNPPGAVDSLTDKVSQREALRDAGLAGPRFVPVPGDTPPAAAVGLLEGMVPPLVVKPRRGTGSRDTFLAAGPVEATAHLHRVLAAAGCPDLIVEEWLGDSGAGGDGPFGEYVSVEAVVRRGTVVPLALTGKFALASPCRETGNFLPHLLPAPEADEVLALAVRAAEALGIRTGALHVEVKLTGSGPRIIEVNGRIGGGAIDTLYAMTHGRTLTSLAAAVALGEPVTLERAAAVRSGDTFVYAYFVQAPMAARTLVGLGNLEELAGMDGVVATGVNRTVGDRLDWRDGSMGYLVSVRGVVDGADALARVPERIRTVLDVDWA